VEKALREDAAMPVTSKEGIQVMKIIEAAFKSNELKKQIALTE
jgi:predicted dehydrogenase